MTDEYAAKLESAHLFQDYIVREFWKRGWAIVQYGSKQFQVQVGESLNRVEIKNDKRFRETGNLYIECAEKSNKDNSRYVPSGIYRQDNAVHWVIGDEQKVFVFGKKHLIQEHKAKRFEYRRVQTDTSIGYLLPVERAEELSIETIEFDQETQEAA